MEPTSSKFFEDGHAVYREARRRRVRGSTRTRSVEGEARGTDAQRQGGRGGVERQERDRACRPRNVRVG